MLAGDVVVDVKFVRLKIVFIIAVAIVVIVVLIGVVLFT